MNNQELELRVKEILSLENFFDMIEAAIDFEKEYKQSNFYRNTKMPLLEVIKNSKMWYLFNFDEMLKTIQAKINQLDLSKFIEIINQAGNMFEDENLEINEAIETLRNIMEK